MTAKLKRERAAHLDLGLMDQVVEAIGQEHKGTHGDPKWDQSLYLGDEGTPCGSTLCFAGWAVKIARPSYRFDWVEGSVLNSRGQRIGNVHSVASRVLGLTEDDIDDDTEDDWRVEQSLFYSMTDDPREIAKVVASIKRGDEYIYKAVER